MSVGYTLGAMGFAVFCSVIWLGLGYSVISAVMVYLVSGQLAMVGLIARAAKQFKRASSRR